jgi:hypothetical protein
VNTKAKRADIVALKGALDSASTRIIVSKLLLLFFLTASSLILIVGVFYTGKL